jgi:hypothetical protein
LTPQKCATVPEHVFIDTSHPGFSGVSVLLDSSSHPEIKPAAKPNIKNLCKYFIVLFWQGRISAKNAYQTSILSKYSNDFIQVCRIPKGQFPCGTAYAKSPKAYKMVSGKDEK